MQYKIRIDKKTLILRSAVGEIQNEIEKTVSKEAAIDFSQVVFVSGSFADELLNMINIFSKKGIRVKLIHLKGDVRKMISVIKKRKLSIGKAT